MELTPSQVSSASFRTVRKGYDPDEVNAFLQRASKALEEAHQQATSMEARARAAVARLQELSSASAPSTEKAPEENRDVVHVSANEAETISRTLVLAQRTADATISDANAEAERILTEARAEYESTLDSTREMSAQLLEEARTEARRLSDAERVAAENEVQSLVARREFLVGDVDQLEQFLEQQRERLRAAARQLEEICDRVPDGLGEVRPPLLSASDEEPGDDTSEHFRPSTANLEYEDDDTDPDGLTAGDGATTDPALDVTPAHTDRPDAGGDSSALAAALDATARFDVYRSPEH
jgi:cell division initiation protein